ncbi:cation:proton antiporter, partial [Patescibacteria group bacterium]|nr:cation:proton antiporter [Patescibacteria group bacterium]
MISILFFVLLAALIGGLVAKLLKLPSMVGFILAGVVGKLVFAFDYTQTENIAELGVILLLFSVGLEISLERLVKVGKVAIIGSILQIVLITAISFWLLVAILNINPQASLVLSLAFSMSSTALIVKVMQEKEELGTIQYDILMGWALIQDLAVIPIVVLLPTLALGNTSAWASVALGSLLTTTLVLGVVFLTGKLIAPYLTRLVAKTNDREFLLLLAICLALGIASIVTLFGISAAFGAFLAGVVISKTQENHAIFSETRPLRDIFTTLFFVALGFLVSPAFVITHFFTILILALVIILLKTLVIFFLCEFFGYKGKTAISVSIGLAQIGEFAFVLLLIAKELGILTDELSQIGIATTLLTLLISPLLIREVTPISKNLRKITENSPFKRLFTSGKQQEKIGR